VPWST